MALSAGNEDRFALYGVSEAYWAELWESCSAKGIPEQLQRLPQTPPEELIRQKETDHRLYLYLRRNLRLIFSNSPESQTVAALVDIDGCLTELVGHAAPLRGLRADGITLGVHLSLYEAGPNAVAVGSRESIPCFSVGEANYNRLLRKYALYFAPIVMQQLDPPFTERNYGGLALLVPKERACSEFMTLASALAHDLMLNFHYSQRTFRRYDMTGMGLISTDTSVVKNQVTITYCNQTLFDLFELPFEDLCEKPLDTLIDPLPHNQAFWEIITQERRVRNFELAMSIRGEEIPCILSTDTFNQPMLNIRGTTCFLSTPKWQTAQVSQKMGNNAVRTFDDIIGQSPTFKSTVQRAKLMANTDSNIMLWGESGVGKDVFAQAIHNSSRRRGKPFIAVNCGALPRDLIASELFGYDGGAFTGAKRQGNIGKFELADGGTLFLDEIGELPLDLQATLLRVVEQKRLTHLGGSKELAVDVKIISATNANLPEMIEQKRFREDLFYRLSTIQLDIPPLRDRGGDIILLAKYFIRRISARIERTEIMELTPGAQELLMELPWRGNVRQLQNLMESIVQLYPGPKILPEYIRENLRMERGEQRSVVLSVREPAAIQKSVAPARPSRGQQGKRVDLTETEILSALEACNGNRSDAAKLLGVARRTLYRYMDALNLE